MRRKAAPGDGRRTGFVQHRERDPNVKWGSLYTVVKNLAKHGFLKVVGTSRQEQAGNFPQAGPRRRLVQPPS
jgi:hypothetical protein